MTTKCGYCGGNVVERENPISWQFGALLCVSEQRILMRAETIEVD